MKKITSKTIMIFFICIFSLTIFGFLMGNYDDDRFWPPSLATLSTPQQRILCLILTHNKNIPIQATAVNRTWGRKCTYIHFLLGEVEGKKPVGYNNMPILDTHVKDTYDALWGKTRAGFQFAYENYLDKVDWVMKSDDDTFVIMENLKYLLSFHDPSKPGYLGCNFKMFMPGGYMSGGAGYILSRAAVRDLVEKTFANKTACQQDPVGYEDVLIGKCLLNAGVPRISSLDSMEEERFLPMGLSDMMFLKKDLWVFSYLNKTKPVYQGLSCCSGIAATFHYVSARDMYVYEYLIYKLRVVGEDVISDNGYLPENNSSMVQLLDYRN